MSLAVGEWTTHHSAVGCMQPHAVTHGDARSARTFAPGGRTPVHLEIIVPVLNAERRITAYLDDLARYLKVQPYSARVVVVDRGSVDRTTNAVRSRMEGGRPYELSLLSCARRSAAAAMRRGLQGSNATVVAVVDVNDPHPETTLPDALRRLRTEHVATVVVPKTPRGTSLATALRAAAAKVRTRGNVPRPDCETGQVFLNCYGIREYLGEMSTAPRMPSGPPVVGSRSGMQAVSDISP